MLRMTITMDEELAGDLDAYIERSGAFNRSEAIRDLVRRGLNVMPDENPESDCVGIVSYAINQQIPGLAKRVRMGRLERHDAVVSTLGIPVDHSNSIDVVVIRGKVRDVAGYAQHLFLERGVRHGVLALIPVEEDHDAHSHDAHSHDAPHPHVHLKIQESF